METPHIDRQGVLYCTLKLASDLALHLLVVPPSLVQSVQMGACFSKVFNGCPLDVHCATTWILPKTRGETTDFVRLQEDSASHMSMFKPQSVFCFQTRLLDHKVFERASLATFSDQYLLIGAEEGVYTLNLNELHEDTLEKVSQWTECFGEPSHQRKMNSLQFHTVPTLGLE